MKHVTAGSLGVNEKYDGDVTSYLNPSNDTDAFVS